jgi:ABC-type transport system substrate-binding protein
MPERLAQESPFKPVSEIVGSGPYRFVKDEHVSGARAVFASSWNTSRAKRLWEGVPFIPLGEYWQASAYRKDVTGIIPGCFATFYGVRRA